MTNLNKFSTLFFLFLFIFFAHFFSKVSYITDSRWTLQTSWALIHHHNFVLDDFKPAIERNKYYAIEERNGHLYYTFPPGTPILCAPFLSVLEKFAKHVYYFDILNLLQSSNQGGMEVFLASLFVALAAVFLVLVLLQWQIDSWIIWLSVFAFAFGTSAWSVASRGLFAHGPSMLFLIAGVWCLNNAVKNKEWLWLAGFIFGFAYIIRPTNSIPLFFLGLYIITIYRMQSWRFIFSSGLLLFLFFIYNHSIYGYFLSPYFSPSHIGKMHHLLGGLAGNFFSPSRGLLVYSPFLILLIPLLILAIKQNAISRLQYILIIIIFLHSLLVSSFDYWYAGWCFGPRFFADMMPFMVILFAVSLQAYISRASALRRKFIISTAVFLCLISCWINYQGANNAKTFEWNYLPNNIDENRARVWDWNDIQFLR